MSTSVADPRASEPLAGEQQSLSGWGRTSRSRARVLRARGAGDVADVLAGAGRAPGGGGVLARGAGRSYGDAAQNGGGDVLDMTGLQRILSIDRDQMSVTAEAGATIAQLLAALSAHRLTLAVVPGTRHVTVGGAIASDVHGKNHPRDGSWARHVRSLDLYTPGQGLVTVTRESSPELFAATLGGMGLTGVVVQATLAVAPLHSPWFAVDVDRTDDLEGALALMSQTTRHRYSVAWLDLLAGGSALGRGVVSRADAWPADHAPRGRVRRDRDDGLAQLAHQRAPEVPRRFPAALLRPGAIRGFNALRWRATPRRARQRPLAPAPHFFPLDSLGAWNRLYGAKGLIQYQFAVPPGTESTLVRSAELLRRRRVPVYLAVLKRLGAPADGPLSFPIEGWTLALDIPAAAPGLWGTLDELDILVSEVGGRVYLTKDARLRPELAAVMYPRLPDFHAQRALVDPEGILRSDLGRRLALCRVES